MTEVTPDYSCTGNEDCTPRLSNSVCEANKCNCIPTYVFVPSNNSCWTRSALNTTCEFIEQCLKAEDDSVCKEIVPGGQKYCICKEGFELRKFADVGIICATKANKSSATTVDPAMIGVLAGLALMFIIICVVLRLFSKARFRENRSIFNTPNPRLMNASLFKDSKLLSPARGDRRGSRASVRGSSRAPSVTSINRDVASRSPNGSLAKERRGSALSTASANGSATGVAVAAPKTPPCSSGDSKKGQQETTVAIEAVD